MSCRFIICHALLIWQPTNVCIIFYQIIAVKLFFLPFEEKLDLLSDGKIFRDNLAKLLNLKIRVVKKRKKHL
jgi:hypothetical protein